jgi:hypothetical protein
VTFFDETGVEDSNKTFGSKHQFNTRRRYINNVADHRENNVSAHSNETAILKGKLTSVATGETGIRVKDDGGRWGVDRFIVDQYSSSQILMNVSISIGSEYKIKTCTTHRPKIVEISEKFLKLRVFLEVVFCFSHDFF